MKQLMWWVQSAQNEIITIKIWFVKKVAAGYMLHIIRSFKSEGEKEGKNYVELYVFVFILFLKKTICQYNDAYETKLGHHPHSFGFASYKAYWIFIIVCCYICQADSDEIFLIKIFLNFNIFLVFSWINLFMNKKFLFCLTWAVFSVFYVNGRYI